MRRRFLIPVVMLVVLLFGVSAQATLVDMNDGTIYDTDTQLSWLKDAGAGGVKTWADANTWAAGLNVGGLTGWRLPTTTQPDASCSFQQDPGGGFPLQGLVNNCTNSEMGYLYYTSLGNAAGGPMTNTGPFTNIYDGGYWAGTEFAPDPIMAWYFYFHTGQQNVATKDTTTNAWAVRSGIRKVLAPPKSAPTPVGYNPQWLIITLVSLTIAGGVLLRRRTARQ